MRYVTPKFAITALRRGRQIEQFLGGVQAGERRGIRWISLSPGREGIGVHLHEVEDVGTDTFWNLTEFPPLDPDDETQGLVTVVTAPDEAIRIAEHDLGADHARWVNQGFACDEYGGYRAALQVGEPHDHGHQVAGMSFTWTLGGHGWADCTVADSQAQAQATASYGRPPFASRLSARRSAAGIADVCPRLAFRHDVDGGAQGCLFPAEQCPGDRDRVDDARSPLGKQGLDGLHPFVREDRPTLLGQLGPPCCFLGPQPDDVVEHGGLVFNDEIPRGKDGSAGQARGPVACEDQSRPVRRADFVNRLLKEVDLSHAEAAGGGTRP